MLRPEEIRHFKNVGAEIDRKVVRRIVRKAMADLKTVLDKMDDHVNAVSKRKGGLGRK